MTVGAARIGEGKTGFGYELPIIAGSMQGKLEHAIGGSVTHLAVGSDARDGGVVSAACACNDFADSVRGLQHRWGFEGQSVHRYGRDRSKRGQRGQRKVSSRMAVNWQLPVRRSYSAGYAKRPACTGSGGQPGRPAKIYTEASLNCIRQRLSSSNSRRSGARFPRQSYTNPVQACRLPNQSIENNRLHWHCEVSQPVPPLVKYSWLPADG